MEDMLSAILKGNRKEHPNKRVYNFLDSSVSSDFYAKLFEAASEAPLPDLYKKNKSEWREKFAKDNVMGNITDELQRKLPEDAIVIEIGGGVYQHRSADAYKKFKNYIPLDISNSSITRYSDTFNRPAILADATILPFKDNSIDCIFTHTFLEHPIHPERVVSEIERVLKPGGIIVHNDAWFCRWWQRYGIVNLKKFSTMTFKEKWIYITARVTEFPLFRIPPIVIKRLIRELFESTNKPVPLHYKKLKPNYNLYLACDEDAASSIDPVDTIRYYESRGFESLIKLTFSKRLLHKNSYIMLKKKQ